MRGRTCPARWWWLRSGPREGMRCQYVLVHVELVMVFGGGPAQPVYARGYEVFARHFSWPNDFFDTTRARPEPRQHEIIAYHLYRSVVVGS